MIHTLALQENVLKPDATALVVFLTTLVLVRVLNRLLFKPVNQILDERERRTRGYYSEARAMLAESEQKLSYYEEVRRQARAEGYRVVEQKRREALERHDQLLAETKREVAAMVAEARRSLREQVVEAKRYLEREAQRTAHAIAGQVLGRRIGEIPRELR